MRKMRQSEPGNYLKGIFHDLPQKPVSDPERYPRHGRKVCNACQGPAVREPFDPDPQESFPGEVFGNPGEAGLRGLTRRTALHQKQRGYKVNCLKGLHQNGKGGNQMIINLKKINHYQLGLRFRNEKLTEVLQPGWYIEKGFLGERIDLVSEKDLFLSHVAIDEIIRSGFLSEYLEILDLKDTERAILFVDGRFESILSKGKYGIWKRFREIRIERLSIGNPQFRHKLLYNIIQNPNSQKTLLNINIESHETCLYFRDGILVEELGPGYFAFWKDSGNLRFCKIDLREKLLEMTGQDIISLDKVSLRLNAVVSYRIVDAKKSVQISEMPDQALYREAQLILRSSIGARKLDDILNDKDAVANEIMEQLKTKSEKFGFAVVHFGIKDIILPGDIRDLMNRVVAAQKEAEANQIVRREETAAMRSQCNTAKIMEQNPTLMRLRELEVLERVAKDSKLNLVLGEKGLTEKIVNML